MLARSVIVDDLDDGVVTVLLPYHGLERLVTFHVKALADIPVRCVLALDPIEGVTSFLPGIDVLAVRVPEIGRQFSLTAVQQVDVVQNLVVVVVLGVDPDHRRLDTQVDVLRYQGDMPGWCHLRQGEGRAEDVVVGRVAGQCVRQLRRLQLGLEEQVAAVGVIVAVDPQRTGAGQWQAGVDVLF